LALVALRSHRQRLFRLVMMALTLYSARLFLLAVGADMVVQAARPQVILAVPVVVPVGVVVLLEQAPVLLVKVLMVVHLTALVALVVVALARQVLMKQQVTMVLAVTV
jgi:hypothetical protein